MKRNTPHLLSRRRRGFTLTEVLLVLAILGVIAAMVIPNLLARQSDALNRQTKVNIAAFETIAKQYAIDHDGDWPMTVDAMMHPQPGSDGKQMAPYLERVPKDAWNQPLMYECAAGADKPRIWSSGKNKQSEEGGGDDISNWN